MAITHERLEMGRVSSTVEPVYEPPTNKIGLVKTILLHNTYATSVTVTLHHDAQNGTPSAANIFLKVTLIPDETFEYAVGHIFAVANADNIEAVASVTNVVNYFIFGAEEDE